MTGAKPVFVDTGKDLTMDPELVERAITPRSKAIMPVHAIGEAGAVLTNSVEIWAPAGGEPLRKFLDASLAAGLERAARAADAPAQQARNSN